MTFFVRALGYVEESLQPVVTCHRRTFLCALGPRWCDVVAEFRAAFRPENVLDHMPTRVFTQSLALMDGDGVGWSHFSIDYMLGSLQCPRRVSIAG